MAEQKLRAEAEALYERRLEELRQEAEREKEAEREQGIRSTIREIQHQRSEERKEQARREAAAEAKELAHALHDQGARLQEQAEELRQSIEDYANVRGRLIAARRTAGKDAGGRWAQTSSVLAPWFRSIFGGWGSLVEVPSEQAGQARVPHRASRSLTDRDPLSRERTEEQAS